MLHVQPCLVQREDPRQGHKLGRQRRVGVSWCGSPQCQGPRDCNLCHAAYMREWRRRGREKCADRVKVNARAIVKMRVRRGKMKRMPCETCGDEAQAHHVDYSKPDQVRWLCPSHHRLAHLAERSRE